MLLQALGLVWKRWGGSGGGEVVEPAWLGEVQGGEDGLLPGGDAGALSDLSFGGL